MGDKVLGVTLEGNPRKPEPESFRVVFPGGDVDIVRTSDNQYWIHVRVDHEKHGIKAIEDLIPSRIVDARLDLLGKHTSEVNVGDFNSDMLYHLAVRVKRNEEQVKCK